MRIDLVRAADKTGITPLSALLSLSLFLSAAPVPAGEAQSGADSRYLELRIYQTQPGERDRFLDYFETHYLESQEAEGMRIWGQFRDLDVPEHFVWMRGYDSHEDRPARLLSFYTGAHWQATSPAVGEMLVSARHVHYLEPLPGTDALAGRFDRPEGRHEVGVVVAQLYSHDGDATAVARQLRESLLPGYAQRGAMTLGLFASSEHPDNFPMLPYITDEPVVAWIGSFPDRAAFDRARREAGKAPAPYETFVLEPGQRSRLYHRGAGR